MNKIKANLPVILLSVCATLLLVIVILLICKGNTFKFSNSSTSEDNNKENTKEIKTDTKKEEKEEIKEETNQEEKKIEDNNVINNTPSNTIEEKSENNLISFFENEEKGITNSESFKDKAKNTFTSIIDFIFYDKEIKGYTFKELTSSAKLKIISLALKIDNKIDSYFPNYKDKIKDKYNDFKGKLALKYLEVSSEFCSNNPDACLQAKQDFATMKESFGFTFDLLKEMVKSGTGKVKTLYENWRDE